MARRVILRPALVDGWLDSMVSRTIAARDAGLHARLKGRLEGALAINKEGKVALLTRIEAEATPGGLAAVLDGAEVGVEAEVRVGWDRDTKVGRMAWGWIECEISTAPLRVVMQLPVVDQLGETEEQVAA